ncbi:MAG: type IV toxin-antitoxin system AbiEi family antitoxin domain-containing protein [Nocardioides sp.]
MSKTPLWLPDDLVLLDGRCPLPRDRPFTRAEAAAWGVSRHFLRVLQARGLIRPLVRGTYGVAQLRDTIESRAAALRMVVPESAVVTDRTAAWLHGIDVLPRSAAHDPTPLDVFSSDESRLRRPGISSGIRMLRPCDVSVVHGVAVTTPLRTATDLGRLLRRYDAIGALDAFLHAGVPREQLLAELPRFKGFRGVVQLRELAAFADPRPESMPESALRLHGSDAGIPDLEPQYWVCDEWGNGVFRVDLAQVELRYIAEYQGERFHKGEENESRDEGRIEWLADRDWLLDEFWKDDVYAPHADPSARLRAGVRRARERFGAWKPQGKFL